MKTITAYRSTDGRIFESEGECRTHELIINRSKDLETLRRKLNDYDLGNFLDSGDVFEFLKFLNNQFTYLGYTLDGFVGSEEWE